MGDDVDEGSDLLGVLYELVNLVLLVLPFALRVHFKGLLVKEMAEGSLHFERGLGDDERGVHIEQSRQELDKGEDEDEENGLSHNVDSTVDIRYELFEHEDHDHHQTQDAQLENS